MSGYQVKNFLISPLKQMFWVLIRSASACFHGEIRKYHEALLMSTQNICFHGEIRKT